MRINLKQMPQQHDVLITPRKRWTALDIAELWQFRELIYYFVWRDIVLRYKQTILGATWAILNPLANMILFTLIFGELAQLDSEGVPYPVFNYAALLPWLFFSSGLTRSAASLVGSANLIKKVYFPRVILPMSSVLGGLPDFLISALIMLGLMLLYGLAIPLERLILIVPLLALLSITAMGMGFWFSALNVRYRDTAYIVQYLVRFLMYATPVVYSLAEIRERLNDTLFALYALNPLVGVIESFRWVLLARNAPSGWLIATMIVVPMVLFVSGLYYFQRQEHYFADYA
jgi:lipopolysaccharide transport system permease protein